MSEITQPHDLLFKVLLSSPETAGALLRERLPPEVAELLAPEPPQMVEGTFVEEKLRPYYSDCLFQARTKSGKPVGFYVLIEHKSYKDEKVGWQIFRGISGFLEQKAREDENWKRLPAVMALLVYHGGHEWRFPNEFLALVDAGEALRPWLLNFRFPVVDLGPIQNKQLSRHARLRAGLMVLKYGTRNPEEQMQALEDIAAALEEAPELLLSALLYLLTTFTNLDEEQVRQVVRRVNPMEEPEMMSIFAQELMAKGRQEGLLAGEVLGRQEGRQEGLQIGEQKGRQEGLREGELKGLREGEMRTLLRLIQRRFGPAPDWVHARLAQADLETLEVWTEKILDADSLDDIFQ